MTNFLWKFSRIYILVHLWQCMTKVDANPRWWEGEVRLVGGKDLNEGTVLIYHNGTWGIVCHDYWDIRDANVVCRQMGYPGANKAVKNSQFGRGRRQVWMSSVHCRGNEDSLSACYFRGWGRYQQNDCDGRWVSAGAICNKRESSIYSSTSTTTTTTKTPKPSTTTSTTTPQPTTTTTTTTRKPTTTTTARKATTIPKLTTTATSARQIVPQSGRRRPIVTAAPRERPFHSSSIFNPIPHQINSRRRGQVITPAPGYDDSGDNEGEESENKEGDGENEATESTRADTNIKPEDNQIQANVEEKGISIPTVESKEEEIRNGINEQPIRNSTGQRQFDAWIYDNSSQRYIMYRSNGGIVTSPPDPKLFTVRSGWNDANANNDTIIKENGNSNGEDNGHSGGDDASQNSSSSSSSSSYSDSSSDSDSETTEIVSTSLGNNGGDKVDEDSGNIQQSSARAPEDDSAGNERQEDEQTTGTITVQEAQREIIQQQLSINQMQNELQRERENITRLQGEIDRANERINSTEARTELREEQRVVEHMRDEINRENERLNQLQQEVDREREVIQETRQSVVDIQRIQQVSTNVIHGRQGLNEVIENVEVQRQDVRLRVNDVRNGSIPTIDINRNTNHVDVKYNDVYLADDPKKRKPVLEKQISSPLPPAPPKYTEFRLEGGRIHGEGRIDIRLAGSNKWGTICGDSWGIREAIVACRHFGVGYARIAVTRSYYGGANMDKVLAGLKCTGKEQRLDECNFVMTNGEPGQVACDRADSVAGISCTNFMADLIPNVTRLEHSAFLQDRYLYYLQCAMEENCLAESARDIYKQPRWTSHTRRLFRFSTIAHNHGNADFRPELERHNWQWHACHQHYHSMDVFAHYDITDRHGNRVAEGMKASFCLEDSECQHGVKPKYDCNYYGDQGLSVGCSDNYLSDIDCQWIDVTDLKPGLYKFQMAINPRLRVPEMSFENNVVVCNLYYNGYHAQLSKCELSGLL